MPPSPVSPALHDAIEIKTLACSDTAALVSVLMPDLAQTLLVQLVGLKSKGRRSFSLYVVYREGGMTFEAITAFQVDTRSRLDAALTKFVTGPQFMDTVVQPMQRTVRRHFKR